MKAITWTLWRFDMFDRLVLKGFGLERQNLFMNPDSGKLEWRRV